LKGLVVAVQANLAVPTLLALFATDGTAKHPAALKAVFLGARAGAATIIPTHVRIDTTFFRSRTGITRVIPTIVRIFRLIGFESAGFLELGGDLGRSRVPALVVAPPAERLLIAVALLAENDQNAAALAGDPGARHRLTSRSTS
jgi:hypothetical protein